MLFLSKGLTDAGGIANTRKYLLKRSSKKKALSFKVENIFKTEINRQKNFDEFHFRVTVTVEKRS